MILRRWRGVIRTAEREAYRAYIAGTGGSDYTSTPAISAGRCCSAISATAQARW